MFQGLRELDVHASSMYEKDELDERSTSLPLLFNSENAQLGVQRVDVEGGEV